MRQIEFTPSGDRVGAIGFGAMGLSWVYDRHGLTERRKHEVLGLAVDLGMNVVDTAVLYGGGANEELVGAALACSDPASTPLLAVLFATLLAALSASQDAVVDAWRIETFPARAQGAALAAYVWGYRVALLASGAWALRLASALDWQSALLAVAALMGAGTLVTLAAREPRAERPAAVTGGPAAQFRAAVEEPLRDFLGRAQAGTVSGLLQTAQQLGGAIGLAAIVSVYASRAVPGQFVPGVEPAFLTSASFTLVALLVAAVVLRPRPARAAPEPEPTRETVAVPAADVAQAG